MTAPTLGTGIRARAIMARAAGPADPVHVAAGALFALVMVLPSLLSSVVLVDWTDSVERGVVGLAEGAVVALWWLRPGGTLPVPSAWLRGGLAAVAAAMVLSTIAAPHAAPAVVRTAEWGMHALFGAVVWAEAQSGTRFLGVWRRASLAGVAGVLGVALALWVSLDVPDAYPWGASFPFLLGPRWLGTYGVLAVTLGTWGLIGKTATPTATAAAMAWMSAGWTAVWWSGSRGAFGAALLGCVVVGVLAPRTVRVAICAALASGIGALASVPLSMPRFGMGAGRLWTSAVAAPGASFDSGRSYLWTTTLDAWQTRPWLGLGPDGVIPHLMPLGSAHAHNTVIQALGEWGWVGGAPFLVFLAGVALAGSWRAWTTSDPFRIVAAGYLLAVLANGMLEGVLYDPGTTLLVTAAAAIGIAPTVDPRHAGRPVWIAPAVAGLALVLLLHLVVLRAVWAPGAPSPESLRWRLVRAFPSAPVLVPVAQWGHAWASARPASALDLARWGERQGRQPWLFYRLGADVHDRNGHTAAGLRARRQADALQRSALRTAPPWRK